MKFQIATLALAAGTASALQGTWEQCGGLNWAGGTACTSGNSCVVQNPYYSQCLPGADPSSPTRLAPAESSTSSTTSALAAPTIVVTKSAVPATSATATTTTTEALTTIASLSANSAPTSPASGVGVTYKASFTYYGAGDSFGSPNCNTNTAACAFFTEPGFSVAASQNLYGVGPGAGAGPACGTCWKIVGETDSNGNKLSNAGTSIIVMINNLCPPQGNPLCSMSSMNDTNQYGANVNFDLCSDSGAASAFFGDSGVGLAVGTVTEVDCSEWSGTIQH